MSIGILLIGDELLTGKRVDKHFPRAVELLNERGLDLAWSMIVGDDAARLTDTLRGTLAGDDIVFSFGGIGATPDDRTRQCAAAAANVPLAVHPEGRAELEDLFGDRLDDKRIRMVEWPEGSTPIPNPINRVPGFSYGDHHFVPGFPRMAWPMVAWVLDRHYAHLQRHQPAVEYRFEALNTPESELIDAMDAVIAAHPEVRVSCLPSADGRRAVDLGLRGDAGAAAAAYDDLWRRLEAQQVPLDVIASPIGQGAV